MGDLMPGIPSVPGDETTWAAAVDQFETLKKGDMPLSLTNWDDGSLEPAIGAGAAIEISGAIFRFPAEAPILDESGVVAGTVYVVIKTADPTVNEATAYFTNVAPEWRGDLNGWYDGTGENRYTWHRMDWDGAAAYTNKNHMLMDEAPASLLINLIESSLNPGATLTEFTHNIPSGADRIISVSCFIEYVTGTWINAVGGASDLTPSAFMVLFNDTLVRVIDNDQLYAGFPVRFLITYKATA